MDSNDSLYGADQKFISEINKMCGIIVDEILLELKKLGQKGNVRKQSQFALELFIRIMLKADLSHSPMVALANNLWQLSQKNGQTDPKTIVRLFICSILLNNFFFQVKLVNYLKNRMDKPLVHELIQEMHGK